MAKMTLDELVAQLRAAFGAELRSVVLYGSAASGEHIPKQSDYNVLVLVDALDDVAFAAAIDALIADPGRRRIHADAGVERAREFSWDEGATRLMAAYRSAVAAKRGVRSVEHRLGANL